MGTGLKQRFRHTFNEYLAIYRIVIEHGFGALKGRFPYLKMAPGTQPLFVDCPPGPPLLALVLIRPSLSFSSQILRVIESLFILHNILNKIGDDPREIENFDPTDLWVKLFVKEMNSEAGVQENEELEYLQGMQAAEARRVRLKTAQGSQLAEGRLLRLRILRTLIEDGLIQAK